MRIDGPRSKRVHELPTPRRDPYQHAGVTRFEVYAGGTGRLLPSGPNGRSPDAVALSAY